MNILAVCDHAKRDCMGCPYVVPHDHDIDSLPYRMECYLKLPGMGMVACDIANKDNDLEGIDGDL